jgi:hypothetical protein
LESRISPGIAPLGREDLGEEVDSSTPLDGGRLVWNWRFDLTSYWRGDIDWR